MTGQGSPVHHVFSCTYNTSGRMYSLLYHMLYGLDGDITGWQYSYYYMWGVVREWLFGQPLPHMVWCRLESRQALPMAEMTTTNNSN